MKFKAHLEVDNKEFILDVPFENLNRESFEDNIKMKLFEMAQIKAVYSPCVDDRQYSDTSSCEDNT